MNKINKLIKFPKIGQYRNTVYNVKHITQFVKLDINGDPVINKYAKMPILDFEGTTKLHGTNASVVVEGNEIFTQSRKNIITPEKDNAGFSTFIHPNKKIFKNYANLVSDFKDTKNKSIVFFGEWCGKGIQKSVAISELEKMFVIFGILLVDLNDQREFLTRNEIEKVFKKQIDRGNKIHVIYEFKTWNIKIDFENPAACQNELNRITDEVEKECPVGKSFNISGVGEGIVWKCITPGYENSGFWFKVKGNKHSKSKVKTLAKVDIKKLNNIKDLASTLANNERLEQMHQEVFDTLNGGETDIKKMGDFIKAVIEDIFKEELDIIAKNGFTGKDLNSPVATICREFIMNKLQFN